MTLSDASPKGQDYIRDMNVRLVLQGIYHHAPISRADLSKSLGLTKATVSSIVQDLIDLGYVYELNPEKAAETAARPETGTEGAARPETGKEGAARGRRPIPLVFAADCGYVLSASLDVDDATILLTDLSGRQVSFHTWPIEDEDRDRGEFLSDKIEETILSCPPSRYGVVGIAVSVLGIVENSEIFFTPYYRRPDLHLKRNLEERFHIPVIVENEANLSAIAEQAFCYHDPSLIQINIHAGVGMGIILDHRLYTGHDGHAGEFGHTIIVPEGLPCPCGNKGCLEQYASRRATVALYRERSGRPKATAADLCDAYGAGDPDAIAAIDHFVYYMAFGLNNILNTLNPDIIVLNCLFVRRIPNLIRRLTDSLYGISRKQCRLAASGLGDMAALYGGICVCIRDHFNIDTLIPQEIGAGGDTH